MSANELTFDALKDRQKQWAAKESGPVFMGLPDRWYDTPHWRCQRGHVSTHVLRSEERGCSLCLGCKTRVVLTAPEDREEQNDVSPGV